MNHVHFYRNWFIRWITGTSAQSADNDYEFGSDDEDDEDKEKEEKKTIKERLLAIQEVSQSVQNTIGYLASLGESVRKYVTEFTSKCSSKKVILRIFFPALSISPSQNLVG